MNSIQIDAGTAGTIERPGANPWRQIIGLVVASALLLAGTVQADVPWCDTIGGESSADCDAGACDSGTAGCDSLGCDVLGSKLMTGWSVRADALFLHRERPDNKVLAFNTNNPAQGLNAESFDLGVHTGFDVALTRALNCTTAVELRYFGFEHWDAESTNPTTATQLLQMNAAVPIFTLAGTAMAADYRSDLHNGEINLTRCVSENIQLLAGFRYLELDERMNFALINAGIPLDYRVTARNRLAGAQVGSIVQLWQPCCHFSLVGIGKAGIYGNDAGQNGNVDTGVANIQVADRDSQTSFVGELNLLGKWCLSDNVSLRGGYNFLWLTDLALASEQLAVSDFASATGETATADLFYHGASAGLEIAW